MKLKPTVSAVLLLTASFSMAEPGTAKTAAETLQVINRLVADSPAGVTAVYVVDAATSEVLLNHSGEVPIIPASNNKLLTTAAALSLLGTEHKLITRVLYKGTISQGTLNGDLVVLGGGDPTISGRFAPNQRDVTYTMQEWADELKKKGIRRISGDIVADDSFFDTQYFHPAWPPDERGEWYSAEISGLAFNDNCVDLSWSSKGLLPGDIAKYQMNPLTRYVTIDNDVKVAAQGRSVERYYQRAAGSNHIHATGTMSYDATKEDSAAIHNGGLYFCSVLREVLTNSSIPVQGRARLDRGAAAGGKDVIIHSSPSMLEICKVVNLNSQNFYAECVTKILGKLYRNAGSWEAGTDVIEEFCRLAGVYSRGQDTVDGSGLSAKNRTSARQLVEILWHMDSGPKREAWRSTLAQGGVRGSLRSRFQRTPVTRRAAKRIFGKTGLIGGVRSLSGFVQCPGGREVYYSIILNQLPGENASQGTALLDDIAVGLAEID